MDEQYPADRFVQTAYGPVEWRRDITDPNTLFDNETAIAQIHDIQPVEDRVIAEHPVARGMNWMENINNRGSGEHALRAVVNTAGENYGLVDTTIEGRTITYITCMANNRRDDAEIIGMVDTPVGVEGGFAEFSVARPMSDRLEGYAQAAFTVRRAADGQLSVRNETVEPLRMGTGEAIVPEPTVRERFSLRSVWNGLRRAVRGEEPRRGYEAFVGRTNWMVSHVDQHQNSVADYAIWMRQNNYAWYNAQPVQ